MKLNSSMLINHYENGWAKNTKFSYHPALVYRYDNKNELTRKNSTVNDE